MSRRLALACLTLALAASTASAQVPYSRDAIPARRNLARIGLDLNWAGVVPLLGAERVLELSVDSEYLFIQTNLANFYAYEAETGRYLWTAHLGRETTRAQPASMNATTVFVANSNQLFAFDRKTGRQVWVQSLTDIPSSATACNDEKVLVGLESGKVSVFDAKTGAFGFHVQTNERVTSRPILANRVIAFGSEDRKLYLTRIDRPSLFYRFAAGGPIVAPLASYGVRTLLVPSMDNTLYAIDLYTGEAKWKFASGGPIEREPLVVDDDAYVVNDTGQLTALDAKTGDIRWSVPTLGGPLLAVTATKVYLESREEDLFIVDRQTGKILYEPFATFQRAGVNLRHFSLGPTNHLDDRLYLGSTNGLIICLREIGQIKPRPIIDPKAKPLGYIPPEGYPDFTNPGVVPIPITDPAATGETPK
jgi:outer membrane protein assembly factor BamB